MRKKRASPPATKADLTALHMAIRKERASKEDLKGFATKVDLNAFVTKNDTKEFATKDDLKAFATKDDLKAFATKDDLKAFATKDDLHAFATKVELHDEIRAVEQRLTTVIESNCNLLRQDFLKMREQFVNDMQVLNENLWHKFRGILFDKTSQHDDKLEAHDRRLSVVEKKLMIF